MCSLAPRESKHLYTLGSSSTLSARQELFSELVALYRLELARSRHCFDSRHVKFRVDCAALHICFVTAAIHKNSSFPATAIQSKSLFFCRVLSLAPSAQSSASLFVYDEMMGAQAGRSRVDQEGQCREKGLRSILVLGCARVCQNVS
jgi:hypothetical protein